MRSCLLLFLCLTGIVASAQKKVVWGYLRDSTTHEPIVLASVTNINTHKTVLTGNSGIFSIDLSDNEVLSFAAVGYFLDTIMYSKQHFPQDTLWLRLAPLTQNLGNVTVTSKGFSRYQLDSMARRKEFLQDIVDYKIPAVAEANSGAGIALNISRFSRHERNKRKAFTFYETNEREAYIDYRFSPKLAASYTGLKDDQLQSFMQQFRPSFEWLRAHRTEEDIEYYINDKLKVFFKR